MMRRLITLGLALVLIACGPESSDPEPSETPSTVDPDATASEETLNDAPREDAPSVGPEGADTSLPSPPGDASSVDPADVGWDSAGGEATSDVPEAGDAASPAEGPTLGECLPNEAFFEASLWAPIFSITCVGCHNPSGLAQATDMVFDISDTPEALASNMAVAEAMALKTLQGVPVLLLKPSNQHPQGHAGGEVVPVGSPQYAALQEWVARVNAEEDPCLEAEAPPEICPTISPGPPMLRLLNRAEYDRTIEALFGFESTWAEGFTPENVLNGFDNQAEVLVVPPLLAEQLRDAAEAIAAQAVADLSTLLPCDPDATPRRPSPPRRSRTCRRSCPATRTRARRAVATPLSPTLAAGPSDVR